MKSLDKTIQSLELRKQKLARLLKLQAQVADLERRSFRLRGGVGGAARKIAQTVCAHFGQDISSISARCRKVAEMRRVLEELFDEDEHGHLTMWREGLVHALSGDLGAIPGDGFSPKAPPQRGGVCAAE